MQDRMLFFSPQILVIWGRQVTETFKTALEKDHSKKNEVKKKGSIKSALLKFDYTKRSSDKKETLHL